MRELVEDKEYKLVKGEQTPRPSRHQYFLPSPLSSLVSLASWLCCAVASVCVAAALSLLWLLALGSDSCLLACGS